MEKLVDWHTADIIAAVRKKGTTVAGLSRAAGLGDSTLANALSRPWPKGEKLLAEAIGVEPWVIWPSRYHDPVTHEFIDRLKLVRKSKKPKE
ncbi:MAG: DNA-binding transcriptional regulator SfsB [Leclercia adecarboxylata]|nr:DNA-binding transcriptional regulator SfsB [Leclercia adecarboxylata]MDU1082786.1 DNA-binding transcriptional regulator SfsB [Leclercia adecarboxylata]